MKNNIGVHYSNHSIAALDRYLINKMKKLKITQIIDSPVTALADDTVDISL